MLFQSSFTENQVFMFEMKSLHDAGCQHISEQISQRIILHLKVKKKKNNNFALKKMRPSFSEAKKNLH